MRHELTLVATLCVLIGAACSPAGTVGDLDASGGCINVADHGCGDVCASPQPSPCHAQAYAVGDWCSPQEPTIGFPAGTLCKSSPGTVGACNAQQICLPTDATPAALCDDQNPCTLDLLSEDKRSCRHTSAPDYVPCTMPTAGDDYCFGGQCQKILHVYSESYPTSCKSNADCAVALDPHSCASRFRCSTGVGCLSENYGECVELGQTACPPPTNTCKRARCSMLPVALGWSATCETMDAPDGALCDDGSPATGPDVCTKGVCGQ